MGKRPRAKMPVSQRAKQFMPFDAVSGLRQALRKKEHEMGLISRAELSEDKESAINEALSGITKGCHVNITYFRKDGSEFVPSPDEAWDMDQAPALGELCDASGTVLRIDTVMREIVIEPDGSEADVLGLKDELVIAIEDIAGIDIENSF